MSKYKENLTEKELIDYDFYLELLKKAADDGLETAQMSIKDGFYNIFADDAKEAGYEVLNVSKGYFNGYIDVYLKKRTETTVDWQQVRIQAAIATMQVLRSNTGYNQCTPVEIAKFSVTYADALVKELKGE